MADEGAALLGQNNLNNNQQPDNQDINEVPGGHHHDGEPREPQPEADVLNRQGKIYRAKKGFFITCIIIAVLIIIALLAIGITLLAITRPSHTSTTILRQGAYVKLEFDSKVHHNLFSKLSISVNDSNALVYVYKVKCNELNDEYVEPAELPVHIPSFNRQYFNSCSHGQWPGKCPIAEYLYLVKASYAVINITIAVRPFEKGEKIRFLVYDDHAKFMNFLNGDGPHNALISKPIHSNVTIVTFKNDEMRKPQSYYFFVIEEQEHDTAEWFTVGHTSTVIASYGKLNGLVTPHCTFHPNEQSKCLIELSSIIDSQCFVGHYTQDGSITNHSDFAEADAELVLTGSAKTAETIGIIFVSGSDMCNYIRCFTCHMC